jgi:peptidyl-prolyl cis-trans isomerase D
MLDAMRRGVANLLTKVLLGLLILAVAVWGIGDYIVRGPARGGPLATVGKTEISAEDFQQAYKEELAVLTSKLKLPQALTPEQAKLLQVPTRALARLIGLASIDLHAQELGVTVSNDIVSAVIKGDPAFKGPTGQYSKDKLRQVLIQQGYRSENQYVDARRRDLWREQLTETLGASAVPQQFLVAAVHTFRDETRIIEYVTTDFGKSIAVAEPDESKLQEFFNENKRKYLALEERKANLLLLTREEALKRITVTDDEVKAAHAAAKDSLDVPEKRRITQLIFPDRAAAEKAYAELSKAKDFDQAATKLGFSAADTQLGLMTQAEMLDPKIAEAAFKLKKNELSRPVEGQYSVVLLRVTDIEGGKKRTFDEVKGEIRDRIAGERVGQQMQGLYEKIEAGRSKGTPLKEIAAELKLPFQEIAAINATGKTPDGKPVIAHADAAKITEAVFAATIGVETEGVELSDAGGFAWFDLLGVTPERQREFDEVKTEVRTHFVDAERRKEMTNLAAKQVERLKAGEGLPAIAKSLGVKVERTPPIKRIANPPPAGLTVPALQQAFGLPKGGVGSAPTADGKSRTIFRVVDIVAAPEPTAEQTAALAGDLAKQMRIDLLEQYVAGLRTRYGFTINEKEVLKALGQPGQQESDS